MGMSASQMRYIMISGKKSDIEFQGQQINQQRTVLSNKSANLYSEMLTLSVPVPPSTADYTTVQYIFTEKDANGKELGRYQTVGFTGNEEKDSYITVRNTATDENKQIQITEADINNKDTNTGRWTTIAGYTATIVEVTDNAKYQDAYNQYLYKQYLYEQEMEAINAKTEIIQQQDKALELQLSQLDTEQNELKTEMEALNTVLDDNVENSYKTFGG